MNRSTILVFSMAILIMVLGGSCQSNEGNASTAFWVRGNCEMCEATIEKALAATAGVAVADYDYNTNILKVDYDSTKVSLMQLHEACAAAGYDTKLRQAQQAAYDALPKCCKKPEDL